MSIHKLIHSQLFSQEQRDVIQMVSTQLGKKDVIIFGKIRVKILVICSHIDSANFFFHAIF
jgi:hypothetical protein